MSRRYEPRFSKEIRDSLPILRGFETKLRQSISPIPTQDRKVTLEKRKVRKKQTKKKREEVALQRAATVRNKRKANKWWR